METALQPMIKNRCIMKDFSLFFKIELERVGGWVGGGVQLGLVGG